MSETINFVSTFILYEKEKCVRKPNTVRIVTPQLTKRLHDAKHIRIQRGYTKEFFTRTITDITYFGGWIIISWNPMESD